MKKRWSNLLLQQKITWLMLGIFGVAFSTFMLIFLTTQYVSMKNQAQRSLIGLAETVAYNSASALVFNDIAAAEKNLQFLRADSEIIRASIINPQKKIFAEYKAEASSSVIKGNAVRVSAPVILDGETIGRIELQSSIAHVYTALFNTMLMAGLLGLLIIVVVAWLANLSAKRLTLPLLRLSLIAEKIGQNNDYTLRAPVSDAHDEISNLTRDFNGMLVQISMRDQELESIRSHLEEEVTKRTADALRAQEIAEAASRAKSMFLSNMSHEIRTPMNAIIGMTHLALKNETQARQRNYLKKVDAAAHGLLGIINDILDFSKIEAGKLDFEISAFMLDDVLARLTDLTAAAAQEKGLELLFNIQPNTPIALIGDQLRLGQILLNLVNNAVKFTDHGEIVLSVHCLESNAEEALLQFEVSDTGIGMNTEQKARLFGAFEQADSSTTRRFGGTGLGLSISEKLIRMMGGKIWCETELGVGSRFIFTVRVKIQADQPAAFSPETSDIEHLHILVVDDNASAREIMLLILDSLSLEADAVDSAEACIAALELSNRKGRPYNLVLMDWNMPEVNGLDAVRAIRNNHKIAQTVTIVMVTAFSRDELLAEAHDVKIDGLLEKPVSPSSMLDSILSAMRIGHDVGVLYHHEAVETPDELLKQVQGAQVLLVEDNELNQELAVDILQSINIDVDVACNGVEALEMVAKKHYDAVLMDCQMPVMDGYVATREIRKDSRFSELPILAMSANAMMGDKEKCLACGMNDHIGKPIDVDALFKMLARWIKLDHKMIVDQVPTTKLELSGVEVDEALKRLGGNLVLYKKFLAMFLESQIDVIQRLQAAWDKADPQEAQLIAHTLKGLAGSAGANLLAAAAGRLDYALREGADKAKFDELMRETAQQLDSFITTLKQCLA